MFARRLAFSAVVSKNAANVKREIKRNTHEMAPYKIQSLFLANEAIAGPATREPIERIVPKILWTVAHVFSSLFMLHRP